MGHSFPPIKDELLSFKESSTDKGDKYEQKMIGDDLGSMNFLSSQIRFSFLDVPLLRDLNLRFFTYGELTFYPSLKAKGLINMQTFKDYTRLAGGFGVSLSINPMISILFFYNAFNFGSSKDDIERRGYLNFNMGFF